MKTFLLLLAVIPTLASATECVDIVPGKSLGPARLGEPAPSKIGKITVTQDRESAAWRVAGPYSFRVDEKGKIDYVQHERAGKDGCYSLRGRHLPAFRNSKAIKKAFPHCEYSDNFGATALVCDGMILVGGPSLDFPKTFRVAVEAKTMRQREEEKAADQVLYILKQEWPYRGGRKQR